MSTGCRSWLLLLCFASIACGDDSSTIDGGHDAAAAPDRDAAACMLTVYRDEDGDDVGIGPGICAERIEPGFAISGRDCAPTDASKFSHYNPDTDGDGTGDQSSWICGGKDAPPGHVREALNNADCDDQDSQRGAGFYERFADGIDSNCDGKDDPNAEVDECSCAAHVLVGADVVASECGARFNPQDAAALIADVELSDATCATAPDVAFALVAQCDSPCSAGPVYFAVANLGGMQAPQTTVRVTGQFRASPPLAPLVVAPLPPRGRSALIEVNATGIFDLVLENDADCDAANNVVSLVVADAHCGFYD